MIRGPDLPEQPVRLLVPRAGVPRDPSGGGQLNQLEAVQRDVAHLLEHGLESAGGPAAAESATPAAGDPGPGAESTLTS